MLFKKSNKSGNLMPFIAMALVAVTLAACGGGGTDSGTDVVDVAVTPGTVSGEPVPFAPTATPYFFSLNMTAFEVGGQVHQIDDSNIPLLNQAGMAWVKVQHKWEPGAAGSDVAGRIIDAHDAGFRVVLSVPGPAYPSAIDYQAYLAFLTEAATYRPDAIEVWNEMNLDREWPADQISAESYVNNMLAPAYNAIKNVNDEIMVITGALAPTGAFTSCPGTVDSPNGPITGCNDDAYIQAMVAAGAENYMDCAGIHFNAGATSPSATSGHPGDSGDGHYTWYYTSTYNTYANTFNKPLCFTELGYMTSEGYDFTPANWGWAQNTTLANQAEWLGEAVSLARASGNVRLVVVFNIDFDYYAEDDPQAGYALLRPDGSCPACDAIAAQIQ